MDESGSPGGRGAPRRRRFAFRNDPADVDEPLDIELSADIRAAHEAVIERFERGLGEIEASARTLMQEAARESWQGAAAELQDLRRTIVQQLSRDQAIGGLIAHADERFQALDQRAGRMEANLAEVERSTRALTEALDGGKAGHGPVMTALDERLVGLQSAIGRLEAASLGTDERVERRIGDAMQTTLDSIDRSSRELHERLEDGLAAVSAALQDVRRGSGPTVRARPVEAQAGPDTGDAPAGLLPALDAGMDVGPIAERLDAVHQYLGQVVEYLAARDQALVDWIQGAIRHGDDVTRAEAARISETLAGHVDRAAGDVQSRVREAVEAEVGAIHDRLREHARVLGEALASIEAKAFDRLDVQHLRLDGQAEQLEAIRGQVDAARVAAVAATDRLSVALHERLADLTDEMRAESEDMRKRLVERAREAGADATRDIDERLGRLSELIQAALGWSVDELDRRLHDEILRAVEVGMADFVAAMDRRFVDLHDSIDERITTLSRSMDGHLDRVEQRMDERWEQTDRALRAGMGALEESITERSQQALEQVIQTRLEPATARFEVAVEASRLGIEEHITRATAAAMATAGRSIEESITQAISDRVTALAQLIRSDNTALAERIGVIEEQAAAKEAIRGIKELAAALPQEISEAMDERLAILGELFRRENRTTVETVARAATQLADRLDRTAVTIGERFDRDVEVVVDQIGNTMQTLASGLQRSTGRNRPE